MPLPISSMARKDTDSEDAAADEPAAATLSWLLLIYRVPSEPSRNRVSVWRELKRQGALFLQQCVCIFPDRSECRKGLDTVIEKIAAAGGTHFLFPIATLPVDEAHRLATAFHELSTKEYEEIMEECDTKFVREIAYERGRENYTYEEAEEIREDFEKIQRWFRRVVDRDWFHAEPRAQVAAQIAHCEQLLEAFEEEVYRRAGSDPAVHGGGRGKAD
jgi:DNA-binding transcriptional regulator PaaX